MLRYDNPVLPGFHPDPSLCRVGHDYFLVTSSFEYFPGVPIFHSRDLVHWRKLGHCLTRESQLRLPCKGNWEGIYAPTLRYHDGTFYMVTTNVGGGGNFYVTAHDPAGPWSEPIWVDDEWFDPSLFFDDDGKVYYTRRPAAKGIVQAEIDVATGKLLGPLRNIMQERGFVSDDIEGPHLYKIGGRYYLMAAEGGTRFGHMESIGRSTSPWGPFEHCPHNPILTHKQHTDTSIRGTGHAELIEAHDGSWWLFFLGTRHRVYETWSHLGRETFLAPVTWTPDGWPLVNHGRPVREQMDVERALPAAPWPAAPSRDDFDAAELGWEWAFLRNPAPDALALGERPGHLRLRGNRYGLGEPMNAAFVCRRQQHFRCRASARLDFSPVAQGDEAGLAVYVHHEHYYAISVQKSAAGRHVVLQRRVGGLVADAAPVEVVPGELVLSIVADEHEYRFAVESAGRTIELGRAPAKLLATELCSSFSGAMLGMFASGRGEACAAPADFAWFDYEQL